MMEYKKSAVKPAAKKTVKVVIPSPMRGEDRGYQARCDMHTLKEAAQITADKPRLNAAKKEAVKSIKDLNKVVSK